MARLKILENFDKFATTNTWHQEVEKVKLLTTTVLTVRRLALVVTDGTEDTSSLSSLTSEARVLTRAARSESSSAFQRFVHRDGSPP